jgi:phenylpyruvate tautomerase PptA (4-oxalocrotonate tautomerase family)
MPILTYQLIDGQHTPAQLRALLVESSALYARVLESPIDRIRVFINLRPPHLVAVAGAPVDEQAVCAPFFDCLVLAGRPLSQRHQLLEGLTDLLVTILGAERARIRGVCRPVDPENWGIAGVPASVTRAAEIAARAAAATT